MVTVVTSGTAAWTFARGNDLVTFGTVVVDILGKAMGKEWNPGYRETNPEIHRGSVVFIFQLTE